MLFASTATQDAESAYEHIHFTAYYTYRCYDNGEVCQVIFDGIGRSTWYHSNHSGQSISHNWAISYVYDCEGETG